MNISDIRDDWQLYVLSVDCDACGAPRGQLCKKNNGSLRKTPHGPRRERPDRDWPFSPTGRLEQNG